MGKMDIADLTKKYRDLGIDQQIDYTKFYLYSLITHSTAIEGSTVTELENQLLFDDGITAQGRTVVEMMMNLDLKSAYEWGRDNIMSHPDITIELLKQLASKVMSRTGAEYSTPLGSFSVAKGDLRLLNVSAGFGGKSYLSYQKVPAELSAFCDLLNRRRRLLEPSDTKQVYELSFWAHYQLVTIHPWADGNGRTSRLLMNLLQIENGLIPTKVFKEEKKDYIQALSDARDNGDAAIFVEYMTQIHCKHLLEEIAAFERQSSDAEGGQKSQKVDRKGGQKTSDTIIGLIRNNPSITSKQMAEAIGINRSAVSKHLKKLQASGLIRRVGPDKGGHWEINN